MKMTSSQTQRIAAGGGAVRRWNRRPASIVMGILVAGITLLATATAASASCLNGVYDEPLPVTSVSPTDGGSVTASSTAPFSYSIVSPVHMPGGLYVRVTSQNTLGQTGTLSDLNMVGVAPLGESSTNFGVYQGISPAAPTFWTNVPGRYYWQAFGTVSEAGVGTVVCHAYASPVYTFDVVAPPSGGGGPATGPGGTTTIQPSPPPLSFGDAKSGAAYMVYHRTHKRPRLSRSCSRINRTTIHCQLAWLAGPYSYSAAGKFWSYVGSDGNTYKWYDFNGKRTWRTCATHRRCSNHSQRFHWH